MARTTLFHEVVSHCKKTESYTVPGNGIPESSRKTDVTLGDSCCRSIPEFLARIWG